MTDLTKTILEYSKDYITLENNWYNWREINEVKLPEGISLPKGNQYLKNIALKNNLHTKWIESTTQKEKFELIKYYIATWGGIQTNSKASMEEYTTLPATDLIKKGKKGIASWSKAIVVHNPNTYAIFDARVAISLNCIQIIYNLKYKVLFPVLSSRNKVVSKGNSLLKTLAKKEKWEIASENSFYLDYINILNTVAKDIGSDISTIEMLLFAKAESLVDKAFNHTS
ncbi:hypothetical protein NO995_09380 [Aestuariibaculum sp. M13]|uniref:hypothetical protein n=1 Tax=Aestuariibaculum sp. M13 TaxID=2967132 RepID=UPI002159D3FE|nr:hypothetical protein [Aestuariibaculum sp. M13]MCR8667892.1 hypothetical protein [Aestuariibaculum sp. M13]